MADPTRRVPENVPGEFFFDSTCIDCDTCRQIAPDTFGEAGEFAFVSRQPETDAERRAAWQALVSCPTGSIGCLGNDSARAVMGDFPLLAIPNP
jgi:ferredoxin